MSREWYAVECRRFRDLRFRRLSHEAQLAVFYLEGLAGDQEPEAIWSGDRDVSTYLQMNGWKLAETLPVVAELHEADWLDTLPDGRVGLPEWDAVQYALSKRIKNALEAARLRGWRKTQKGRERDESLLDPVVSVEPVPQLEDGSRATHTTPHDTTGQYTHRVTYAVRTQG
jgi:hypothetical protein